MADAQKLAEEAKKLEEQAKKDKDDSDPNSQYATTHTKKDLERKKKKAEKEYSEAAEKREKAAKEYGDDHTSAAGQYSAAADDWGQVAGLQKDTDDEEKSLQKQISDLLRAAEEYERAEAPAIAADKKKAAEKIKADYDKDHPKSKLKLEK